MDHKDTTEQENIPDFVNLEEYNNLLGELEHLKTNELNTTKLTLIIDMPEILVETTKLLAVFFNKLTLEQYLKKLIANSLAADIEIYLGNHPNFKQLYALAKTFKEGSE